jgi:hypothetical protein
MKKSTLYYDIRVDIRSFLFETSLRFIVLTLKNETHVVVVVVVVVVSSS